MIKRYRAAFGLAVRGFLARARDTLAAQTPANRRARAKNRAARAAGLSRLQALSLSRTPAQIEGTVLVDCAWDNANYWIRYALLRAALNLSQASEIGVLGRFQRERAREALAAFGISREVDAAIDGARLRRHLPQARALLAATPTPDAILAWKLPHGFPPGILYDGLLKRQRAGVVDLAHPQIAAHVAEALAALAIAEDLVAQTEPQLVVLSHAVNFHFAAFAWAALRRGIRTILLQGDFGVLRAIQMRKPSDIFAFPTHPSAADLAAASDARAAALGDVGQRYIAHRLKGLTTDVSAIYAFGKRQTAASKASIAAHFGWDAQAPLMLVMAANWFDFPHASGAEVCRDFIDWTNEVVAAARDVPDANWLFKAHPCDDWYGYINGPKLADLVPRDLANAGIVDKSWKSADLLEAADGVLTFHGTGGIEAASLGKPVLVPYAGWYGHAGFATVAADLPDYRATLRRQWWRQPPPQADKRAQNFAGWFFGMPSWHGGYTYRDDATQDAIWWDLDRFCTQNAGAIAREIETIAAWFGSDAPFYHVYKMAQVDAYSPPVGQMADAPQIEDPRSLQHARDAQKVGHEVGP